MSEQIPVWRRKYPHSGSRPLPTTDLWYLFVTIAACVGLSLSASAQQTAVQPPKNITADWSLQWQPLHLVNGAPVVFQITPPAPVKSLAAKWLDHEVYFFLDPKTKSWYGIAGVSLETTPGDYVLTLQGTTEKAAEISFQQKLTVAAAKYPSMAVTVSKKFTEPSPEQLQQIKQDKEVKAKYFAQVSPEREWTGDFRAPVDARVSDVFGTQRTFNGKVQSSHQGLDYAVPPGTPVFALNSGTVLLARFLYFEGNCVVIDHGQGLLTLYLHLSEFKVKEGEQIVRGQLLGLSGGTGRATGPHLHVAVRWEGVYLDPATLLSLKLP
jgi:murein DD-endopeptidase MepM/ murein hydrolase activator NlpD